MTEIESIQNIVQKLVMDIENLREVIDKARLSNQAIERVRAEIEDIDRMAELSEAYGTPQGRLTAIALRDIANRLRVALGDGCND